MKASEKSTKYLIMECTPCLKTDFVFLAGVYFPGFNLPLERRVNESSPPGKETEKKKTFEIKELSRLSKRSILSYEKQYSKSLFNIFL